jgi:hypothetical protein
VARAGEGQQGRARAAAGVQVTRGEGGSRRWSGGGSTAAARGEVVHRRQRRQSIAAHARGRRKEGGPKGLCGNIKNLRDPTIK